MISYASNKSISDEEGTITDGKNNKLKPMFQKSGGLRPFTGFHSDLIIEEDMVSKNDGANADLRDSDSKKSGGSRKKSSKGKRPPGTSYKGQRLGT